MKKILLAMMAVAMIATTAMAQDSTTGTSPKAPKRDLTEMVKKRTENTVKKYGLTKEQEAKLLELNTKYAKEMRGPRQGRRMGQGFPNRVKRDSIAKVRPNPAARPNNQERRRQMVEEMEKYNKELQSIMTEEQYKNYQADMQKRMLRTPQKKN